MSPGDGGAAGAPRDHVLPAGAPGPAALTLTTTLTGEKRHFISDNFNFSFNSTSIQCQTLNGGILYNLFYYNNFLF